MSSGQPAGSYEGMTTEELFDQYRQQIDQAAAQTVAQNTRQGQGEAQQ